MVLLAKVFVTVFLQCLAHAIFCFRSIRFAKNNLRKPKAELFGRRLLSSWSASGDTEISKANPFCAVFTYSE